MRLKMRRSQSEEGEGERGRGLSYSMRELAGEGQGCTEFVQRLQRICNRNSSEMGAKLNQKKRMIYSWK